MKKKIIKMLVLEEREVEISKESFFDRLGNFDLHQCAEYGLYFSRIEHYKGVNHLKKCVRCYALHKKAKKVKEGQIHKRKKLLESSQKTWDDLD